VSVLDYACLSTTCSNSSSELKRIIETISLETMLVRNWPQAKFEFDRSGNEWQGVLDLYRAGGCDVLAVGRENNMLSNKLMNQVILDAVFPCCVVNLTPAYAVL